MSVRFKNTGAFIPLLNGSEVVDGRLNSELMLIVTAYRLDPQKMEELLELMRNVKVENGEMLNLVGLDSIEESHLARLEGRVGTLDQKDQGSLEKKSVPCKIVDLSQGVFPPKFYSLGSVEQNILQCLDMALQRKTKAQQREMRQFMKGALEDEPYYWNTNMYQAEWLIEQITKDDATTLKEPAASSEYTAGPAEDPAKRALEQLPEPSSELRHRAGKGPDQRYTRLQEE
ncbi:MAG: hypothetical protein HZB76_05450 [Chlamydiae bacterium]|nr:hypothetical protein [Chlamydiota bacterium]